jgi:hypothetical protein
MARDLHGQDPVLGYTRGQDVQGNTQAEPTDARRAGLVLCGMAITEGVEQDELEELLLMIGVKVKAA